VAAHGDTVRKLGLALTLAATLAAGSARAQETRAVDPWEGFNRFSYGFSQALDKAILGPVTHVYMAVLPKPARQGVHNVLSNLDETTTFVNRVAQLRIGRAARTAVRFATNSTLGVGGLFDVASRGDLPSDPTDFGQTLARYGAGTGPYLYVPVMGPSNVRDSIGKTVDIFTSPLNWTQINRYPPNLYTRIALITLDTRAGADPLLREVEANATDPYATLRALYVQNRQSRVDGGQLKVDDLPDFEPAPEAAPPTAPPPAPAPAASVGQTTPAWMQAVLADRPDKRLSR